MNSVCIKTFTKHNSKKMEILMKNATLLTQLFMSPQSRNNGNISDFFNMKIIVSPFLAECSMLMLSPCSRYGCFYSHCTFSSCTNNDYIHLYEESNVNGEMNKITLPYRHRIHNSSPGCFRSSTLPLSQGGFSAPYNTYE